MDTKNHCLPPARNRGYIIGIWRDCLPRGARRPHKAMRFVKSCQSPETMMKTQLFCVEASKAFDQYPTGSESGEVSSSKSAKITHWANFIMAGPIVLSNLKCLPIPAYGITREDASVIAEG
ncbi:hypothetical protein F5882DRAFT_464176 [Hyaloscypha sp. PMI_1271]|nr:hypothetical protein F5882DRAFT_464176 [Hyaloscypha sp. PMI_1271]